MPKVMSDGSVRRGDKMYGPGDVVSSITGSLGLKKCGDCDGRGAKIDIVADALAHKLGIRPERKNVSLEILSQRMSVCRSCDRHEDGRCKACGCFCTARAKPVDGVCPLGKW